MDHTGEVFNCTASSEMGWPDLTPKAMQALMIPASTATHTPRAKRNSATLAVFCSWGSSASLDIPAAPHRTMPTAQTSTPARVIRPEWLVASRTSCLSYKGGISVPKTAQQPSESAMPRDMPR